MGMPHPIAPPDCPNCPMPDANAPPQILSLDPTLTSESGRVEGDELVGDSRRRMSAEASVGFEEQLTLSLATLLVALW